MTLNVKYFLPTKRGSDLTRTGILPFVPHAGMWIDPEEGNYREVESVYYHVEECRLVVWFEAADQPATTLRKWGWEKS